MVITMVLDNKETVMGMAMLQPCNKPEETVFKMVLMSMVGNKTMETQLLLLLNQAQLHHKQAGLNQTVLVVQALIMACVMAQALVDKEAEIPDIVTKK